MNAYVSYLRVSTTRQGIDGLGIEAQRAAVEWLVQDNEGLLLAEYREVESGKANKRPELDAALTRCRKESATLVVAKLDRLSRNAGFLLSLRDSGVNVVCCDYPEADRFMIGVLALMAERERDMISQRTKEALGRLKERGVSLGCPNAGETVSGAHRAYMERYEAEQNELAVEIKKSMDRGHTSTRAIAYDLGYRGIRNRYGRPINHVKVSRLIQKITQANDR